MEKIEEPTRELMNLRYENDKLKIAIENINFRIDSTIAFVNKLSPSSPETSDSETIVPKSKIKEGEFLNLTNDGSIKIRIIQILPYENWVNFEVFTPDKHICYQRLKNLPISTV